MNYPLIEKWLNGVQVWSKPYRDEQFVVLASELEAKLAEGFEVYRDELNYLSLDKDWQVALAIGKQPIKKKTREEAALEFIERLSKEILPYGIIKEAKEILEMK